jgi:hypothetical protein
MIPIAAALTFVWLAWTILDDYIKARSKIDAWELTGNFGKHLIKLAFVAALLSFPLPKFISETFVAPIMNVGLSYNHVIRAKLQPGDESFNACVLATALEERGDDSGAYPGKLRANIACQIAEFHKLTGLGMTVGWTFANMGFAFDYMYFHVFPNVLLIFAGIIILFMFLWALLPVPIYFLEVFITLSLDMIMLPLMLLGWLFNTWDVFPNGIKSSNMGIKKIVDDVAKSACGIALVGLFMGFAMIFLSAAIGEMNGIEALAEAIRTNDSKFMMDALKFNNNSLIGILMIGLFLGMFMNAIPKLVKRLFANASIPNAEATMNTIKNWTKNIAGGIGKKLKTPSPSNP